MTTPAQPLPLSFTVLSGTPTAVVFNGNTAIVGYSTDTSDLFDLTNPANPQFLGTITGVGGSLFIYNGTLFSTGAVPGVPTSALGGVHAASLGNNPITVTAVSFTGNLAGTTTPCPQVTPAGASGPGAGCINVFNDVVSTTTGLGAANLIMNPVWQASNAASANYPVAYVQGQTITLTVTLAFSPVPTVPINNVTITGQAVGLGNCIALNQTFPAQPTYTFSCTMSAALPANQTKFYNPLVINWSYSIGTTTNTNLIGATSHQVYVTLAPPLQYTTGYTSSAPVVYRTALNFAVSVDGATDQGTAFWNTWNQFTTGGTGPASITAWLPPNATPQQGRRLYYYRNDPGGTVGTSIIGFNGCALNETGLLLGQAQTVEGNQIVSTGQPNFGSGQCGSFAYLLIASLAVNGIHSAFARVIPSASIGTDPNFLVNAWSASNQSGPWKLCLNTAATNPPPPGIPDLMVPAQPGGVYCDLTSSSTLYGQNTQPPSEKIFSAHFIVKPLGVSASSGGPAIPTYVDPSYGVTYASATDFESKAVFGYVDLGTAVGTTPNNAPIFSVSPPTFGNPKISITP